MTFNIPYSSDVLKVDAVREGEGVLGAAVGLGGSSESQAETGGGREMLDPQNQEKAQEHREGGGGIGQCGSKERSSLQVERKRPGVAQES